MFPQPKPKIYNSRPYYTPVDYHIQSNPAIVVKPVKK